MPSTETKPSEFLRPQRGVISELFYKGKRFFLPIPKEDKKKINILFSSGNINDKPQTITPLSQSKYGTISGKIDDQENAIDALRREAKEEFGIEISVDQIEDCGLLNNDHVLQLKDSDEHEKIMRALFSLHVIKVLLTDEQYVWLSEKYGLLEEKIVKKHQLRPELQYQLESKMEDS